MLGDIDPAWRLDWNEGACICNWDRLKLIDRHIYRRRNQEEPEEARARGEEEPIHSIQNQGSPDDLQHTYLNLPHL